MNGKPIIFDQEKDEYVELVCRMYKVPRTQAEVVESALSRDFIDSALKLTNHPLTNIHMQYAIFMRVAWAEAVLYGLVDPDVKHRMLLRLRETFRVTQRWPEQWQEAVAPAFLHWMEVLEEERRNGTT
jgi:hypothetical protein